MSITVWLPDGPVKMIANPRYDPKDSSTPKEIPEYIYPELSVVNGNAMVVCGLLAVKDYPALLVGPNLEKSMRSVMKFANSAALRKQFVREERRGVNFVVKGCDELEVESYCTELLKILRIAQEKKLKVALG